jgi:hypothetical protein
MNQSSTGDSAPSEARKRGSGGGSPRNYNDLLTGLDPSSELFFAGGNPHRQPTLASLGRLMIFPGQARARAKRACCKFCGFPQERWYNQRPGEASRGSGGLPPRKGRSNEAGPAGTYTQKRRPERSEPRGEGGPGELGGLGMGIRGFLIDHATMYY